MTDKQANVTQDDTSGDDAPVSDNKVLKVIVIVLGIAIIGMVVLIVGRIIDKLSSDGTEKSEIAQTVQPLKAGGKLLTGSGNEIVINRPEGSELVRIDVSGAIISAHFILADGSDAVVLVNGTTGAVIRWIKVPAS